MTTLTGFDWFILAFMGLIVANLLNWRITRLRHDFDWASGDIRNHEIRLNKLDGTSETTTNRNVRLAREAVARIRGGQHVVPPDGITKPVPPPCPPGIDTGEYFPGGINNM